MLGHDNENLRLPSPARVILKGPAWQFSLFHYFSLFWSYFDACKSLFAFRWRGAGDNWFRAIYFLLQRRQRPCFDVRWYHHLKITESAILCKCFWELWRHAPHGHISKDFIGLAAWSWWVILLALRWGFLTPPGWRCHAIRPYTWIRPSRLLPSGILSLDGLHQWSADLSWWVQTNHLGLVYSTRLVNLRGQISCISKNSCFYL